MCRNCLLNVCGANHHLCFIGEHFFQKAQDCKVCCFVKPCWRWIQQNATWLYHNVSCFGPKDLCLSAIREIFRWNPASYLCWNMHMGKWLAAMLATKRSAGVTPEVNLREHISCVPPPSVTKTAHSGFETQRRCHQKSKTVVSVAPQKDLCPPKIKKKDLCQWLSYQSLFFAGRINLRY